MTDIAHNVAAETGGGAELSRSLKSRHVSMIAIGGGLALIGNSERLAGVGSDLKIDAPASVWEIKVLLILLFLTNAFLKFVWSHRLFGYCAVVMAAVPNDPTDAYALPRAQKAGEINITAAKTTEPPVGASTCASGSHV